MAALFGLKILMVDWSSFGKNNKRFIINPESSMPPQQLLFLFNYSEVSSISVTSNCC